MKYTYTFILKFDYYIREDYNIDFENAYLRYIALDSLQIFGVVKSINDAIGEGLYVKYFYDYDLGEKIYNEQGINTILLLDSYLNKNDKSNISNNINNLLGVKNNIFIKEIKKIEYRIYVY